MVQAVNWDDQVQVQILEMQSVRPGEPIGRRMLWDGISLAEAVRRWLRLPEDDDRGLVTIFGTQTFTGREIGELAKRPDFPR